MKLTMSKSLLTFIFFSIIGLLIAIVGNFVLPDRFLADTSTILNGKPGLIGSYPFTSWFYKTTSLGNLHFSIIGFIQFITVIFILYKIGVPNRFYRLTLKNIILYLSIIILGLFMGMPTKEFITFLYIALLVWVFQKKNFSYTKTILLSLLLLIFFGYFFRPYFTLIAVLMVTFHLSSFIKFKNKHFVSILYGLVIGISLSYGLVKGSFLSQETREKINKERIKKETVNTIILSPVEADTWYGETFSIIYGFFTVNLPVNGLKHFLSPHILAFILWEILLFYLLYIRFGKCFKEGKKENYDLWLFYFLFSYLISQGIFEPDLGSAVRHKIGIFPVIYYLLNYENFRDL